MGWTKENVKENCSKELIFDDRLVWSVLFGEINSNCNFNDTENDVKDIDLKWHGSINIAMRKLERSINILMRKLKRNMHGDIYQYLEKEKEIA